MNKQGAILISGGLGALSTDIAKRLVNSNRQVLLLDIKETDSFQHDKVLYIKSDISDGRQLEKNLLVIEKENIKLDGIVNTAAVPQSETLIEASYDKLAEIVNVKLLGYANVVKAAAKYLNKDASIVNVSSVHAHQTKEGFSMYAAANAGVIALTRALAIEFKHKARFNTVTPGGFLTPVYKQQQKDWSGKLEKGQILDSKDVTEVVLFLLSDKSRGINASEIIADVGVSAVRASSSDW